jgi:hypothetical protein
LASLSPNGVYLFGRKIVRSTAKFSRLWQKKVRVDRKYTYIYIYKRESGLSGPKYAILWKNSSHDPNATKLCQTQFEHLIKDIKEKWSPEMFLHHLHA